jgi:hypothetical protein
MELNILTMKLKTAFSLEAIRQNTKHTVELRGKAQYDGEGIWRPLALFI